MAAIILLMAASFSDMKLSARVLAASGAAQPRLAATRIGVQRRFEELGTRGKVISSSAFDGAH
jgi:hypothetical protein